MILRSCCCSETPVCCELWPDWKRNLKIPSVLKEDWYLFCCCFYLFFWSNSHKHINNQKSVDTYRSSLSLTSLFSSVSCILSWPATTVLLLEVVPEHQISGQRQGSAVSRVFGYNIAILFYPSVRWRPCCWQRSDRKEGCHSGGPLGLQGLSAGAQIGAPPSSGWYCCDTGRSPPFWSETGIKKKYCMKN